MAKILIYKDVVPNGEYDIFRTIDYQKFRDEVGESACYNVGNRAWLQGIIVALEDGKNELVFLTKEMTPSQINAEFDFIVLPMANIFQRRYIADMERLTKIFSQIKVPTYVIACGAQADSFDQLEELVESVKEPASRFIRSIYETGGEFALRGFFTKDFFDKLGFPSAVVTGCPSMYQLGPALKIEKKAGTGTIKAAYNGSLRIIGKKLLKEAGSVYLDQDEFYGLLFALGNEEVSIRNDVYVRSLVRKYGYEMVKLAMEHRAMLFLDVPVWRKYLMENKFNFSYGTRIHGNIISILSGIPALICACDSRTREMAEFYAIPMIQPDQKERTLAELYELTDYSAFNANYAKNYKQFERFLVNSGLVTKIGTKNLFFTEDVSLTYVDWVQALLDPYRSTFEAQEYKLFLYDQRVRLSRKAKQITHKFLP
ncbi:polysaccharide pyruvyl transferase family protein [Pseudoflavonifractor phocaeensis]|uniref:polysaccharide pyruvyl transferase family protein n=1 Tax=Pseudoflavonifractor phocaeensis TaxID=1870988 RepID=UPI00195BE444|nr:polysaccharide pyruvyl transferase family protein [Pseudoflavonifractor phocaeensis]MBM6937457.1 polysaccharide pyruvyl transferase family protein [Pseudoflavonifractor phocaeensis]